MEGSRILKQIQDPEGPSKIIEIKTKTNKWDLINLISFYPSKETIKKKNEKTTYRMGENICKLCDQQGLTFQNIEELI